MAEVWRQGEVLAWTEGDGPGRPPKGPNRTLGLALAGVLGVVFAGVVFTDTLCPEHRAWVITLASGAFLGTVVAIVGLVRGWASAPLFTLAVAATGVAVGLIDATHSPTRGRLIATGFALACAGAAALATRSLRLRAWDRSLAASLRSAAPDPGAIPEVTSRSADHSACDASPSSPSSVPLAKP